MTLGAVLLAGGESRRMGADKAQLIFEDEPLWQRQIRLLCQLEPKEIFISARHDPDWRPGDFELVLDKPPSRGPMSGICAALSRISTSHLFVLAVDMPFVLEKDLRHLVSRARDGCGVIPVTDKGAEPLAAIYPKESKREFEMALSSSSSSVKKLVDRLVEIGKVELVYLASEEAGRLRSINTPEDMPSVVGSG